MTTKQAPRAPRGMVIQTLILSKTVFKTMATAAKWVRDHGFKVGTSKGKVPVAKPAPEETSTSFRFRQRPPGDFQAGTLRTIKLTEGVSAVVGRLKVSKAIAGVCANSTRGEAGQSQVAQDLLDLLA